MRKSSETLVDKNPPKYQDNEFDLANVIVRSEPFHLGHKSLIDEALRVGKQVVVVLGSAFHARTARNPFTWQERADMIVSSLSVDERDRVSFVPVRDYYDNEKWVNAVRKKVAEKAGPAHKVALVGHYKDASSKYLDLFRGWTVVESSLVTGLDATTIRKILFEAENLEVSMRLIAQMVPKGVLQYLKAWTNLPCYTHMVEEHSTIERERKKYPNEPYVTCDCVVTTRRNRVLLIKRSNAPGKGLWALPGGFLDVWRRETLLQCALREGVEETGIGVLESTMEAAFRGAVTYDHPDRAVRGRTITHVHFFELDSDHDPEVHPSNETLESRFFDIADLAGMEDQFFDDHFHVLNQRFNLVDD